MKNFFKLRSDELDHRLAREFGLFSMKNFYVNSTELPGYRFVDLYRTVEAYCEDRREVATLDAESSEDLNGLLHGERQQWMSRRVVRAPNTAWATGPETEEFLPVDRFWLTEQAGEGAAGENGRLILRLRFDRFSEKTTLEAAADVPGLAQDCLDFIVKQSVETSIYKNQTLELTFEAGTKDEYGDIEKAERLRLLFKASEPVEDDDIVIDEDILEILQRNVIDLHTRRDVLKAHGVPIRRGVLLYGPPGTGKTFACRYLCGRLPETTRLIVTGTALHQVNAVFTLARLFQPSLVILEDVDLVFSSREINLYSSALGDMLDQMDGLRTHEDIGFVLTTNAIDRMEAAIRDRPGRISQCINFEAPNAPLRKRYLLHYLKGYPTDALDMDDLVEESAGATQAFLKEWVHRAVQIATESLESADEALPLVNKDFHRALNEMKKYGGGSSGRIIGFQTG